MNRLSALLAGGEVTIPTNPELVELAVGGGLTLGALALGYLASRTLGPRLAEVAAHRAGLKGGTFQPRIAQMVRHLVAALLLAIVFASWPWRPIASLPIGLAWSAATAMFAMKILRGLNLPRWAAWAVAGFAFVSLFSYAVGGLTPITTILGDIGVEVGDTRITLLSVTTVAIAAIVLYAVARLASRVINHAIGQAKGFDPAQKLLFQKLAGVAIIVVAFFVGVDMLGIDLTTFAVFSGALGLAVGFGLQKTVGNLIAGIILLMDRSIKPGDVIVVGEDVGWVNKIGVRAVSVITRDGKEHLIPNENLMTEQVENWSYSDRNVRVRIKVGVSYDCDLKLAQELMLRAAAESPRVLETPKPNIWLTEYGDNSVNHEILAWISDPEGGIGNVRSDVLNRLWWLFKEHGVEIPYPKRDVYVKTLPSVPRTGD
ncbi:mechanosensitive ion channel family protein [Sphingomonas japonica]|uniref:Small-conductance mechanosensitive channel n=1 Tax=Sphingomonas japonica TaxID=511662 RepID=A0ABX0U0I5_9SPHN|nr:mechanosensitive ion channel domain-containing protein [Sphingomonas japonica]NIJ24060.1 small-conductance mechanosensitive channel [Sphingomonas japonica]